MPDFSQPGSDGVLPCDFSTWQWGVACTVRPEILSHWAPDQEFQIGAIVRRQVSIHEQFNAYGGLYDQARAAIAARVNDLQRRNSPNRLGKWIVEHGWSCIEGAACNFPTAWITMGIARQSASNLIPRGQIVPSDAALSGPATEAMLMGQPSVHPTELDEMYIDFDFRAGASEATDIFTFSYGEYLASSEPVNFETFVERAELQAKSHHNFLMNSGEPTNADPAVVKREWMFVRHPDLVVVHIYFRI